MFAELVGKYHLHPIVDHFTIALLTFGVAAELLSAAVALLSRSRPGLLLAWSQKLRSTSLMLMIGGAAASVLSYFTGDAEADRLWDTISPAAQQILLSTNGPDYLSHAVLGQHLMYAFLILAAWRVMLELYRASFGAPARSSCLRQWSRRARCSTRARPVENSFTNMVSECRAWLARRKSESSQSRTNCRHFHKAMI
jgi:uncharacterized membrane protein